MVNRQVEIHNNLLLEIRKWIKDDLSFFIAKLNQKGITKKEKQIYIAEIREMKNRVFNIFLIDADLRDNLHKAISGNENLFDDLLIEMRYRKK